MSTHDMITPPLAQAFGPAPDRSGFEEVDVVEHRSHGAQLTAQQVALFVDMDGTLLDIARRPDDVFASPELLATLELTYRAVDGALAIVSGRRIRDIDRILDPLRLPSSGVHGAQIRATRDAPILEGNVSDIPPDLANSLRMIAQTFPGVLVEDKREAIAIHWRECPQHEARIHDDISRLLQDARAVDLSILRGHCVFEIKPATTNKGNAVRDFMQRAPFAARRPVFIGDDVTDIAGIAAAKLLGGLAFSVGAPLPGADDQFATPHHVRMWLQSLATGGAAR